MREQIDDYSSSSFGFVKKLARNFIKKSKIKDPPINLKDIFKNLDSEIKVNGKDLGSEDGFSIGSNLITYNSISPRVRQRFTVAHELGHIVLGHNNRSRIIDFGSKDINEQQANVFASELLVPLQMLKRECSSSQSLTSIANKFWVSREMMQWRLRSTKLDTKLGGWE